MIMEIIDRKEVDSNGQEMIESENRKNAGLVGDQNNSIEQPIIEPECTNPYCQVCHGIDGRG